MFRRRNKNLVYILFALLGYFTASVHTQETAAVKDQDTTAQNEETEAHPDQVRVTFYNRLSEAVELFYMSPELARVKVADIEAEDKSYLYSSVGDVFVVSDSNGSEHGPFRVMYDNEVKSVYDLSHDEAVQVHIHNELDEEVTVFWYMSGMEEMVAVAPPIKPGEIISQTSWYGHVFVAKKADGTDVGEILMEHPEEEFIINGVIDDEASEF